ncbi:MAG: TerB N-terminal domain-containing protein [Pseudomonadota bacterium]
MGTEQRGLYLRWLCNVTNQIDIGYVFVYYYGLERHLVYGDFEKAFDEIILLRNHHNNGSFRVYSASALVHSCLLRKRVDKLHQLYTSGNFDYFGNSNLLILHHSGLDILPDVMFQLACRIKGVNHRYIKQDPNLYKQKISGVLIDKFGQSSYPLLSRFLLKNVENIPYPIFANISLPPEVRTPSLPNLLRHEPFLVEMKTIFRKVHDTIRNDSKLKKIQAL